MERCEVTVSRVRQRHSSFFRLTVYHYDSGKYINNVFFQYSWLKSYAKKIGIDVKELPYLKDVRCNGYFFRTNANTDLDWKEELRNWYKERE